MKVLKKICCMGTMLLLSCFIFSCMDNSVNTDKVNVSYDTLKDITEKEDICDWQGLNIIVSSPSRGNASFKSNKHKDNDKDKVDFEHIKSSDDKVYCDDDIRYHKGGERNYIDESKFDYKEYLDDEVLNGCLEIIEKFFNDSKNLGELLSSDKVETDSAIVYTFQLSLDKNSSKVLIATYTLDKNGNLVSIKLVIYIGNEKDVESEIKENKEVVVTPEWFDNDDYKTALTYEEVKAIVNDENLLNGWDNAEWFLPVGYSEDTEDKIFVSSKSQGCTYTITETTKEYFNGNDLYKYTQGEPSIVTLSSEEKEKYTFQYKCSEFKNFAYNYFFKEETVYKDYYVASKKYEKDITVVSYKYFGEVNDVRFESICSLIYDTQDNLIEIKCYAKQESQKYASFELNLYMRKLHTITTPLWFNENDFNNI